MIYYRLRTSENFVPPQLHPPAQIDLFLVSKKEFIKAVKFMIAFGPHKQDGSTRPKNGLGLIILPGIFFAHIKYPAPAKRIAIRIYPPSGSTRIFKYMFTPPG